MMLPAVLVVALAALGLAAGSFVSTAALRFAHGEQFFEGRSRCDQCGVTLRYIETIPIVSFAWRRGRCASCGAAIDPKHLVGEAATALIVVAAFLLVPPDRAFLISLVGLATVAAALVDVVTFQLPDTITVGIALLSLGLTVLRAPGLAWQALASGAAMALLLEAVRRWYFAITKRPGLGRGDVKLAAAFALWLGPTSPIALTLAACLALAAALVTGGRATDKIAFGPAIGAAAIAVGLFNEAVQWSI